MEVYERLLDIVNSGVDLEEYLARQDVEKNYDELYQLSLLRRNVLAWYDFAPNASLLEVGAECGALTGLFCEKVSYVVAYDPDASKCAVNRARNASYENLTVVSHMLSSSNSGEAGVKATTTYDYVTIIGNFTPEKLEFALAHLRDGGKLIIAVDNKFGMKRWSGEELEYAYSRKEISQLLKDHGIKKHSIYYPVPDYRFPLEVYSGKNLPKKGDIKTPAPALQNDQIYAVNEIEMLDELIEDGRFEDFASSFVIIVDDPAPVNKTSDEKLSRETFYVKYNSLRRPEYRLATEIVEMTTPRFSVKNKESVVGKTVSKISEKTSKKEKLVVKKAITKAAEGQIQIIKDNYELLKDYYNDITVITYKELDQNIAFDFIKGESILSGIDFENDSIDSITGRVKSEMELLLDVREDKVTDFKVTDEFAKVFPLEDMEQAAELISCKAVCPCNFDTIFSNFIRVSSKSSRRKLTNKSESATGISAQESSIVCIDYEWVWDFPVPIDFLKYRMLHYLYEENETYLAPRVTFDDFISFLNLSDEVKQIYHEMEMDFQYYAHGEDLKYLYLEGFKKTALTKDGAFELMQQKDHEMELKDQHIENLNQLIDTLNQTVDNLKADYDKVEENLVKTSDDLRDHIDQVQKLNEQIQVQNEYIQGQNEHIQGLEGQAATYRRCLTNPLYAAYYGAKHGPAAIRRRYEAKQVEKAAEEKARLDEIRFHELLDRTEGNYQKWIERQEANYYIDFQGDDIQTMEIKTFEHTPKISIVVPVYNVEDRHLLPCIESVRNQTYTDWELILVDDCSTMESVAKTLAKLKRKYRKDPRFVIESRTENGGISRCTNTGIELATGDYIAFMDCDDTIAPFALYEVVKMINNGYITDGYQNGVSGNIIEGVTKTYDFIYSDEDKLSDDGTLRHSPFFKPNWSPDTLMSYMYTSHLGVYKAEIVKELGGLNPEYDGCQDYDFTLRFTEKTDRVGHISKVLYHWREREESTASNPEAKDYVKDATRKCKEAALERRGLIGNVEWIDGIYQYRVNYRPEDNPLVSIVIPSKDNPEILEQCLKSLVKKTNYRNYEVVVVDNGSNDENRAKYQQLLDEVKAENHSTKYLYAPREFNFSFMCNIGARSATGEYLLFLNDDIEITEPEWLERMVGQAELPHVGAVGAKLLYPETTLIQHDGVISIESGPVHQFARMDDSTSYYFNRNRLDFDTLAVTAACLMVKKDRFEEIEGFDENLAVAYNDIDLCFKLIEKGYKNVIRNDAILYHHESISRGDDAMDPEKFKRLMAEQDKLYEKHPEFKGKDPFYNKNLVQTDCDFSLNYDAENDYKVTKIEKLKAEVDDSIRYGLDVVRNDWCIYIEGWAFKTQFNDNINLKTKILLENENKTYILNTAHVRREDVVETFSDENCITFCGFKSRISRDAIEPGEYTVRVLCNKMVPGEESYMGDKEFTLKVG